MGIKILDHKGHPVEHRRRRLSTGIPKTSYHWRKVIPFLTPSFTVVVPDMRGIGDSDHPANGYDMATVADDLAELMTTLGHETFHACGEDWGGAALYQLAVRHPSRVKSLIFQEMMLPGFGLEDWAKFDPNRPGPHLWQVGFYAVPDVPELLLRGREPEYFSWFIKNEAADPASIDDDAVDEYVRTYSQPGALRSMCSFFRARATIQQNHEAAARTKLTVPVLAIGAESFIGREVKRQMERVAQNVQYAEFDYGHQLAEECPEMLSQRYLSFLNQIK
ncbi:hydrolase or acyltransferase of alpha/beta superfamily [Rasamsonia emersonii CBS 393.64]|uniref:Hydrolase or acyltransferase of alpha/beta superfamily n=1 Tax=Rasamsonia emersonii (strain ATCC 16479 / CBS 393.64 / IMI 116815) TaxID=1408163 RepID=A0A0F4Z6H8_RASE3|nr:hydrolase or acyltransferase of alpha/beta superfamily [Rasamsonia emersonii CBS 393.64]KKA25686.1 hydrolase or acyltransferase of alpha/beta superfamily [Rasamsonia emersonii CBS 393.64]